MWGGGVIKRLKKVGNGNALFLDRAVLELVGLDDEGEVNLTVHDGSLIVTPARPRRIDRRRFEEALGRVVRTRRAVLRRLAE